MDAHATDSALLGTLGERLAEARLARNRTQADLAREAGISRRTLVRLEAGESTQLTNLIRVLRALGLVGNLDALVPAPAPSPLAEFRDEEARRQRATGRRAAEAESPGGWTWGDEDGETEEGTK